MSASLPPPPPPRPILLTGLASAALLDGRGDVELAREMRGTVVECGGVTAQCIRLTGAWRFDLRLDGVDATLPSTRVEGRLGDGGWHSRHRWQDLEVDQSVSAVSDAPGVVRTLRCAGSDSGARTVTVTSSFVPFLVPVLVEGIRPHWFDLETSAEELRVRQRGFGLSVRSSPAPSRLFVNRGSWIGGRRRARVDELGVEYELAVGPGAVGELRVLISGGLLRDLDRADEAARCVLADPVGAAQAVAAADRAWTGRLPSLRFPQAPELEVAYARAAAALRRLYCAPETEMTGLVAGYPWYSALWCRDLGWMLPALLWLGDFDWVQRSIDTVLRFQSRTAVPLLGGEEGELPMQLAPGPVFFYGTSDTTLYFPALIDAWRRHSGAGGLPAEWSRALERIVSWGAARTDPATGLLRNGGEAEEISDATGGLARVGYGIDAPDTTIWDSADRRSHAIDVQVLWWQTLALMERRSAGGASHPGTALGAGAADRLATTLRRAYRWAEEGYLYDSIRDGRPVAQIRPNALRAVSAGLFGRDEARAYVARALRDDLTTPWGVRTLSSRDPSFDPIAYHGGQVWTIATAWAADAALVAGEAETGARYLGTIADRLAAEEGYANECYRGDRPEPFDSCFLLGFSVAPFLTVLFERLWGLRVDAPAGRLSIRPTFPAAWRSAAIERLRVGAGTATVRWEGGRLTVGWSGPGALDVDAGGPARRVASGTEAELRTEPAG
ncbi:MAG TPA: amylo-alpha-1,6-glucosidase [Thermoplasmata archaeon]|nr:amylo-alpha-1,6-glucosidase [Thermoplasmata archaeon]